MTQNLFLRLSIIIVCGLFFTYKIFEYKYSFFVFEAVILFPFVLLALLVWLWFVVIDLRIFKRNKEKIYLLSTISGLFFITITTTVYQYNQHYFKKPALLKIYHDGDIGGTGINFNDDGTYVFYNSAMGLDTYEYGVYKINGDTLKLDKGKIDNVIKSSCLIIKPIEVQYASGAKIEEYAFQTASDGSILTNTTEFRVVIDKRK